MSAVPELLHAAHQPPLIGPAAAPAVAAGPPAPLAPDAALHTLSALVTAQLVMLAHLRCKFGGLHAV